MSTPPPRSWRAACPNCGAAVDFASAASPIAVCSFCRSTLARDGDALRRIGASAELFDDHSPLQLGASGAYQGVAFTLVGRLQMRYADGAWNEWHTLFDSARSGWLSEDNGRYVIAFDAPAPADAPRAEDLRAGLRVVLGGRAWEVSSVVRARVAAAEGELPFAPQSAAEFVVADLRNAQDEVATLDWSVSPPHWSIGRSVALADLSLRGLREATSEKTLSARGLQCPNCGAAVDVKLDTTRSIACSQCHAVIDVSKGIGGDLAHYRQDGGRPPQIPLGAVGTLALGGPPQRWQVVGYAERCEIPDDADDERVFWREYLLYHRTEGFAFIVDAEDGWSWAAPITGAPQASGNTARWRDTSFRKLYDYRGETTYVLGEFYWKQERGQQTANTDYAAGRKRLNREQAGGELTWSAGETLDAAVIAKAFDIPEAERAALARDASPVSAGASGSAVKAMVIAFVAIVLIMMLVQSCSRDDCDELRATFGAASNEYRQCVRSGGGVGVWPRSSGGSYGGYRGGGGHK